MNVYNAPIRPMAGLIPRKIHISVCFQLRTFQDGEYFFPFINGAPISSVPVVPDAMYNVFNYREHVFCVCLLSSVDSLNIKFDILHLFSILHFLSECYIPFYNLYPGSQAELSPNS